MYMRGGTTLVGTNMWTWFCKFSQVLKILIFFYELRWPWLDWEDFRGWFLDSCLPFSECELEWWKWGMQRGTVGACEIFQSSLSCLCCWRPPFFSLYTTTSFYPRRIQNLRMFKATHKRLGIHKSGSWKFESCDKVARPENLDFRSNLMLSFFPKFTQDWKRLERKGIQICARLVVGSREKRIERSNLSVDLGSSKLSSWKWGISHWFSYINCLPGEWTVEWYNS